MKLLLKSSIACLAAVSLGITSCKKDISDVGILNEGNFSDNAMPLKEAADFPVGVAIGYTPMTTEEKYSQAVLRDFDAVTFEYEMKHGAIVKSDGTYNFTRADALVAAAGPLDVFGHVLGWHQNQNAGYLKSFAGITVAAATELLPTGGFESGLTGWSTFNTNGATVSATTVASEVRTGTGAMKVVNPTANPGNQWRVQVSSAAFATVPGKQYVISYWVKALAAGGSIRLSSGPTNAQYQGDQSIGTSWQQVSWTITADISSTTFLFDMGQAANTYLIDDASVKEVVAAPSGSQIAVKLDQALSGFISAIVGRYKSKVKAWDVVNELFVEDGNIRNNNNTPNTASDVLIWSNYLGRDYALKAFNYAKAADPAADLYINDYNLESNAVKLDSLIKFVAELKAKGAKVDGIGTQMHITRTTGLGGIDAMMAKLGATGLKIRISELDVRTVLTSAAGKPTAQLNAYQAEMVRYVVASYIRHIPAAQRAGITIWGVNDKNSWLSANGTEFALLYDDNYNKKASYAGFLQGLK